MVSALARSLASTSTPTAHDPIRPRGINPERQIHRPYPLLRQRHIRHHGPRLLRPHRPPLAAISSRTTSGSTSTPLGAAPPSSPPMPHKLAGSHLADSLAVNPHKMMNVPVTCSFLLANDLRKFHKSNTLPAGYLFHGGDEEVGPSGDETNAEVWDLADLTLQCGRRGDSLKLALGWIYYGTSGFSIPSRAPSGQRVLRISDFRLPPSCLCLRIRRLVFKSAFITRHTGD